LWVYLMRRRQKEKLRKKMKFEEMIVRDTERWETWLKLKGCITKRKMFFLCEYIYIYVCVRVCACVRACVHVCVYVCVCVYIYICVHTHMHTYIYISSARVWWVPYITFNNCVRFLWFDSFTLQGFSPPSLQHKLLPLFNLIANVLRY